MAAAASSSKSSNAEAAAAVAYMGSLISLISMYEIRYEGVLYHLSIPDSTIGLKNVRSYGTEDRKKDGPHIPPGDKVYEFILFRGSDIKDLQVKSFTRAPAEKPIDNDPAIIQSQYSGSPSASSSVQVSVSSTTLEESAHGQDTPALTSRACSGALPLCQSVNNVGSLNLLHVAHSSGPSLSKPMYWPGYNGTTNSRSHAPQIPIPYQPSSALSSPLPVPNQMPAPGLQDSLVMGLTKMSGSVTPLHSVPSTSLCPNFSSSLTPVQYSASPGIPTCSSPKMSPPFYGACPISNGLTACMTPLCGQDMSTTKAESVAEVMPDVIARDPAQSVPCPVSSVIVSTSISLLKPSTSLICADLSADFRQGVVSSMEKVCPTEKDRAYLATFSSTSPPLLSTPGSQAPLLPLPGSVQQHKSLTTKFVEEFDFEAMNEKFKKEEIWGYLGKAKQRDKIEGVEDNAIDQSLEDREASSLVPKFDPEPAYKKDEFFDTISCNSLTRGRNGQNPFSERMKLDTETFGCFNRTPNLAYGGYGVGRGLKYNVSHNQGRSYGYGGRGHGNMPC